MGIFAWTWIIVGASFVLYIGIALWTKATSTADFYAAEQSIHPILNGMATGSDWLSAASFISMAGMISFMGRDGSMYLMGWTGGYVLLAMLIAPYLRKYGKFTIPQFIGDRYYSQRRARHRAMLRDLHLLHLRCRADARRRHCLRALFGDGHQYRRRRRHGLGLHLLHHGRHEGDHLHPSCPVLRIDHRLSDPAIFISVQLTGNPVPQLGYGSTISANGAQLLGDPSTSGRYLLDVLNSLHQDLGFTAYTAGVRPKIDVLFITFALMVGTAGMPHVIMRFFTVPRIRDARSSAGYALICIALLYTTAPAVAPSPAPTSSDAA